MIMFKNRKIKNGFLLVLFFHVTHCLRIVQIQKNIRVLNELLQYTFIYIIVTRFEILTSNSPE